VKKGLRPLFSFCSIGIAFYGFEAKVDGDGVVDMMYKTKAGGAAR